MKFELFWGTGNEFCNECKRKIEIREPYLKLMQNRWAKPILCEECLEKFSSDMKRMKNGEVIIKKEPKIHIVQEVQKISKNGWMENYY